MGRAIVAGGKPAMGVPVPPIKGIALSTIAEGSIVKLNENGTPVEFYVAKHNYESGLNGSGRTLLVRKYLYDTRTWHSSNVNAYASSTIDSWLNGSYKALLDAEVQEAINGTKIYYTPGNGSYSVTTLERAVFLLSAAEYNAANSNVNTEGSALPIASDLKSATLGSNYTAYTNQWTRTPRTSTTNYVAVMYSSGSINTLMPYSGGSYGSRPCFTLPATALFDEETMILKGVA